MPIGKHAQGLRGFPTPEPASTIEGYLLFYFPDKEWAQYVIGAAKALSYGYNWYQAGEVSVDEAAAAFRDIIDQAPYNTKSCANPDGGKIIRVAPNGHVQQLSDANSWEDTTGDYAIPPVPVREGSEPDIKCLAAKNAANVLNLLYENVSDSFASGLDEAAAGVALIESISLIVGVEFAPITFALVSFSAAVFGAFYAIMEFATADLWTNDFTQTVSCYLLECANNDAGVITFDWDCFNSKLAEQVNVFDLSFAQLRLFGQIQYLLFMVGGVDALNLAGATTAITDDDCEFCGEVWTRCVQWTFTDELNGMTHFQGEWDAGWEATPVGGLASLVNLYTDGMPASHVTHVEMTYSGAFDAAHGGSAVIQGWRSGVKVMEVGHTEDGSHITFAWDGDDTFDEIDFIIGSGSNSSTICVIEAGLVRGLGEAPDIMYEC